MPHPIPLPETIPAHIGDTPHSVLLQTSRFDIENYRSYLFLNPVHILSANSSAELVNIFAEIESALAAGHYVAGFLSYEAGYHLQGIAHAHPTSPNLPLAWFGVFCEPTVFDHRCGVFTGSPLPPLEPVPSQHPPAISPTDIALALPPDLYRNKILQIKEHIAAGATYQVNFTDRIQVQNEATPAQLFRTLTEQQPVAYSALLNLGELHILSLSPELFFRVQRQDRKRRVFARPMKGTWPRGLDAAEDAIAALALQNDAKNRSEHLMIVDLLRNDLGRLCTTGSIQVDDLFSIERYPTLLQMTSTISGTLAANVSWYALFRSLFPCGSVTGAPKISTMRIIRDLETSPRGIYTGAIGFIAPSGDATFNVAIRTLLLENSNLTLGVGGGIVFDSDPAAEYAECLLKARFLSYAQPRFDLLETILWDGSSFTLLDLHLDRLQLSCTYFSFPFDADLIRARLNALAAIFGPLSRHRVRLTLDKLGQITLSSSPLAPSPSRPWESGACRVTLSPERTSSTDVFLRHKTTHRPLYDRLFDAAQRDGFDDILFLNERFEVTEGAISNLFAKIAGRLYTPPVTCGVLPGIFRRHLLDAIGSAGERILTLADLRAADELYLCNSVRGLRRMAHLDTTASGSA